MERYKWCVDSRKMCIQSHQKVKGCTHFCNYIENNGSTCKCMAIFSRKKKCGLFINSEFNSVTFGAKLWRRVLHNQLCCPLIMQFCSVFPPEYQPFTLMLAFTKQENRITRDRPFYRANSVPWTAHCSRFIDTNTTSSSKLRPSVVYNKYRLMVFVYYPIKLQVLKGRCRCYLKKSRISAIQLQAGT
jgi:hypothetical protein